MHGTTVKNENLEYSWSTMEELSGIRLCKAEEDVR
jgi:hypothetical protein